MGDRKQHNIFNPVSYEVPDWVKNMQDDVLRDFVERYYEEYIGGVNEKEETESYSNPRRQNIVPDASS